MKNEPGWHLAPGPRNRSSKSENEMYSPKYHVEENIEVLQGVIRNHGFALLIGEVHGAPFATHVPFMLDETHGECGKLVSHMANRCW